MSGGRPSAGWSLRRRIGLWLAVAVTALWLAAATVAGLVLRREIDEVFDSALQEVAQRVLPLAYSELLSREDGGATQHMAPIGPHREYIAYVVRDKEGRELLQSSGADLMNIPGGLAPATMPPTGCAPIPRPPSVEPFSSPPPRTCVTARRRSGALWRP